MVCYLKSYIIFCFWTENNEMSENRKSHLQSLVQNSNCNVILITPLNLDKYILKEHPLHPAYQYLSATHKSDYLRTYFMNFYGGRYSDIKGTRDSWKTHFNDLLNSNKWVCGYPEVNGGVAYNPLIHKWSELVGNGCYICKPNTPFTNEWYNEMIELLDKKMELLKENPATNTRDCFEISKKYPIEWNEMLGRIFHKYNYKYKEYFSNELPMCICENYR